jgi:hypothetical protein
LVSFKDNLLMLSTDQIYYTFPNRDSKELWREVLPGALTVGLV